MKIQAAIIPDIFLIKLHGFILVGLKNQLIRNLLHRTLSILGSTLSTKQYIHMH
jgi:hypothetical protein